MTHENPLWVMLDGDEPNASQTWYRKTRVTVYASPDGREWHARYEWGFPGMVEDRVLDAETEPMAREEALVYV